jgi:hypothetical protein
LGISRTEESSKMKRIQIVALCVTCCSCPAFAADWTALRHDDEAGFVLYLDKSSVVKKGADTYALFLFNFQSTRTTDDEYKRPYRSIADYNYVNCTDETIASEGQDIFSEEMGNGKVVNSFRVKKNDLFFTDVSTENGMAKYRSVCAK